MNMAHTSEPTCRVSIIIVNYNGGELLQRCIQSVYDSCHQDDEIILVDNASQDGSAQAVEHRFPAVRVIYSQHNLGFGDGNNLGVAQARGTYVAFLNPDAIAESGWLDPLIDTLQNDSTVGMTTSKILLLNDPDYINTCGNKVHYTGLALCQGMGARRAAFAHEQDVNAVSGAAFAMRRAEFEALGGFDGAFFLYMEDTDLSLRVRLAGFRIALIPSSLVYHQYSLRFGPHKTYYQERNRYRMLLKTLHWQTLLALTPGLLLAEVTTWGFVLLRDRGRMGNKLRAYASVLADWPDILHHRRQTQATRRVTDRELLREWSHELEYEQAGEGLVTRLAHRLIDPSFLAFKGFALALIRW